MLSRENLNQSVVCAACLEKDKRYRLLEKKYHELEEKYQQLQERCEKLEYQLSQLVRHRFGQKSEKGFCLPKASSTSPEKKTCMGVILCLHILNENLLNIPCQKVPKFVAPVIMI